MTHTPPRCSICKIFAVNWRIVGSVDTGIAELLHGRASRHGQRICCSQAALQLDSFLQYKQLPNALRMDWTRIFHPCCTNLWPRAFWLVHHQKRTCTLTLAHWRIVAQK
jgi:hypothetical protein